VSNGNPPFLDLLGEIFLQGGMDIDNHHGTDQQQHANHCNQ
jgi:hypothetical protein